MPDVKRKDFLWRLFLSGFVFLLLGTCWDIYQRYGILIRDKRLADLGSFPVVIGMVIGVSAIVILQLFSPGKIQPLARFRPRNKIPGYIIIICTTIFTIWVLLKATWGGMALSPPFLRSFLILSVIGFNTWLITEDPHTFYAWDAFLTCSILMAAASVIGVELHGAVDYPFQLSWSEGNRFWDYSLMFGKDRYRYPSDEPIFAFINPVRQFLWGIPFLFKRADIQFVRLWSGLLFCLPYFFLGLCVFWAKETQKLGRTILLASWSMVFLNQGPVYAPLVICAILVAGARFLPLWLGFIIIAVSGYLAEVSRITWMFAPAIWAVLISMLEPVKTGTKSPERYRFVRSALLGFAGALGGFLLQKGMDLFDSAAVSTPSKASLVSVDGISSLVSNQPLIWNRLLPNPTYPLGILINLMLVTLPVLILVAALMLSKKWRLSILQYLTIFLALAGTLVVGLVVSVKIGGGNNLHNMDMFLITLLIVAAYAWQNSSKTWISSPRPLWVALLLVFMIYYPLFQSLLTTFPLEFPDKQKISDTLQDVQGYVDYADSDNVLFIDQRQLLTFSYIKDVDLLPQYEKKHLMDNALRSNVSYFENFYRDIADQRFSLIVSEPLWVKFQGEDYQFGNENDIWVKWVSIPILCYYKVEYTNLDLGIQLLTPKDMHNAFLGPDCPVPEE
jgi:hypothetical protein